MAKFCCLLVHHWLSPTNVHIVLTWDRDVMVLEVVAGLEIDFARLILEVIHEKAFKTFSTYHFYVLSSDCARTPECPK